MEQELINLGILFLFAVIGGILSVRLKQPTLFGLLLVGAIIGPNMLNIVNDQGMIDFVTEVGIMLLLFTIGIEFNIVKLVKTGFKALWLTVFKVGVVFFLTFFASLSLGYSSLVSVFLGLALSFTSTLVFIKVLEAKNKLQDTGNNLLLSVLVFEDIFAIILFTFFTGFKTESVSIIAVVKQITFGLLGLLLVYFLFLRLSKPLIRWMTNHGLEETIIFLGLGLCAVLSSLAYFFGLSPSIGAFLAGSIIAILPDAHVFKKSIHPFTLVFTSLFFLVIGTVVDLTAILDNLWLVFIFLGVVFVSRLLGIGFGTFLIAKQTPDRAFYGSLLMLPIGEFSLIIAREATLITHVDLVTLISLLMLITAVLMPTLANSNQRIYEMFTRTVSPDRLRRVNYLSGYVHNVFEELDTENKFTKTLKSSFVHFIALLVATFVVFIALDSVNTYLLGDRFVHLFSEGLAFIWILLINIVPYVVIGFLLYKLLKKMRKMYDNLIVVLTNMNYSRSVSYNKRILNRLLVATVFLFSGLYIPFFIALMKFSPLTNVLAVLFLAVSFYFVHLSIKLIEAKHSNVVGFA